MNSTRTIAAAAVALVATLTSGSGATASTVQRYTYVASSGAGSGVAELIAAQPTPVGHVSLLGDFHFEPVGSSFSLKIVDESVLPSQTVTVRLLQQLPDRRAISAWRCFPVQRWTKVTGFVPGVVVWAEIQSDAYSYGVPAWSRGCTGHPTVGTALVDP